MKASDAAWKQLLTEATERVQESVLEVVLKGACSIVVGTGASGDKTLLADKRAEEELFRALSRVEGMRVLSEEAGSKGDPEASILAVLDPLDGSSNFERGIPFYCTSVAIIEGMNLNQIRCALVRDLVTGDVYFAERGGGAIKNGKRIRTANRTKLEDSVLDVDVSAADEGTIARLAPLVASARRQVHYGANALELCFLAEGRIDAVVDVRGRMRATDFAGGYLIATEAGAVVSLTDGTGFGSELNLKSRFSFVASANRALHRRVMGRLGALK